MIDFALMNDKELKSFIKTTNFKNLKDSELQDCYYELTEVPFRKEFEVPTNLELELKKRKL